MEGCTTRLTYTRTNLRRSRVRSARMAFRNAVCWWVRRKWKAPLVRGLCYLIPHDDAQLNDYADSIKVTVSASSVVAVTSLKDWASRRVRAWVFVISPTLRFSPMLKEISGEGCSNYLQLLSVRWTVSAHKTFVISPWSKPDHSGCLVVKFKRRN